MCLLSKLDNSIKLCICPRAYTSTVYDDDFAVVGGEVALVDGDDDIDALLSAEGIGNGLEDGDVRHAFG